MGSCWGCSCCGCSCCIRLLLAAAAADARPCGPLRCTGGVARLASACRRSHWPTQIVLHVHTCVVFATPAPHPCDPFCRGVPLQAWTTSRCLRGEWSPPASKPGRSAWLPRQRNMHALALVLPPMLLGACPAALVGPTRGLSCHVCMPCKARLSCTACMPRQQGLPTHPFLWRSGGATSQSWTPKRRCCGKRSKTRSMKGGRPRLASRC